MKDFKEYLRQYAKDIVVFNPDARNAEDLIATAAIVGYTFATKPWEHNNELFSFGAAINALKLGFKVRREKWDSKQMLWLKKELPIGNGGVIPTLGTICMYTPQGEILTGWLATQSDMLSEDWEIVR